MTKIPSGIMLVLLMINTLTSFKVQTAKAEWTGTVYIWTDGSVHPSDAPVSTVDNITYTLTGNITSDANGIVVERNDIIFDGAGYAINCIGVGNGMNLTGGRNVTITNVKIYGGIDGIELVSCSYINIINNFIMSNNDGIHLDDSHYNTINENNISTLMTGISTYLSSGNNINRNNIISDSCGIDLHGSFCNSISENKITARSGDDYSIYLYGIFLGYSSNNNVTDNIFVGCGLSVMDSYGNLVKNNLVNDKPLVYLENVSGYVVKNAGQVVLVNCEGIMVENLDLSMTSIGVQLWGTTNTTIFGNTITNNSNLPGIHLCYSSNNSISGNTITNNYCGICLDSSSDNKIFHNNFIDNRVQVSSYESANIWDDGYPSGGNFWSDYTGVDEKSGSDQDQPGGDGIGDTPYVIDENNVDRYPLMRLKKPMKNVTGTLEFTAHHCPPN
jgi:parallel beta-helix repeat protein